MMMDIVRYQVDIVTGDANASVYKGKKIQPTYSIRGSSFVVMLEAMVRYVNTHGDGWPNSLAYQLVTSNTQARLRDLENYFKQPLATRRWEDQPDVDCVVAAVMSWGHHQEARRERQQSSDATASEAVEGFRSQARIGEYYDWILDVSEFTMNLTNRHLWLGADDHDWHTPLHVIIRPRQTANLRKRSAAAKERRHASWKAGPSHPGGRGTPYTPGSSSSSTPKAPAAWQTWTADEWRAWHASRRNEPDWWTGWSRPPP
jgi:hypothetical protein